MSYPIVTEQAALPAPLSDAFASFESIFSLDGELITRDRLSELIRVEKAGQVFYVKRYRSAGKGLHRHLSTPRIQREWQNLLWFSEHGIATAELICYGLEKRFGIFHRGMLITREIPYSVDLASLARQQDARLQDDAWIKLISQQAAAMLRRMHAARFVHNDFKWRNLLVDDQHTLYVIDSPLGRVWPGVLFRYKRIKDLVTLDRVAKYQLRQTQRLRFFLYYLGKPRLQAADKRLLRKMLTRKQRRKSSFAKD